MSWRTVLEVLLLGRTSDPKKLLRSKNLVVSGSLVVPKMDIMIQKGTIVRIPNLKA
jgi:hypothetical protein